MSENMENLNKNLEQEIQDLKKINNELTDKNNQLLYSLSSMQNSIKIQEKEITNTMNNKIKKIVFEFINIIDLLDFAHQNNPSDEGIVMLIKNILKILKNHEIEEIETNVKDKFNTELHEAMFYEENKEFEKDEIIKIIKKGYKMKNQTIRHAQVSVAK